MHRRDPKQDSLQKKRFDDLSKVLNEDDVLSKLPSRISSNLEFSDDEDEDDGSKKSASIEFCYDSPQLKSDIFSAMESCIKPKTPDIHHKPVAIGESTSTTSARPRTISYTTSRESAYYEALKRISEMKTSVDKKLPKLPQNESWSPHQAKPSWRTPLFQGGSPVAYKPHLGPSFSSQASSKFTPSNCRMRSDLSHSLSVAEEKCKSVEEKPKTDKNKILHIKGKQYNMLFHIGKGGSSNVYAGFDIECRKLVAIKRVDLSNIDKDTKEGYVKEIQYLERLKGSDYVIKMYAHEYIGNKLYLVLEKGDIDLSTYLSEIRIKGGLDPLTVRFYWSQMLKAVAQIHQLGVVHSDLKPANFVLAGGHLKLIDFGIAVHVPKDVTSIYRAGPCGTLNYISPEALNAYPIQEERKFRKREGNELVYKLNYKSDVWSLGCILYLMVYGRTPFHQFTTQFQKMNAIINPDIEIVYGPHVEDPAVIPVLKMCLQRNPNERASVDELLKHSFLTDLEKETPNTVWEICKEIEKIEKLGGHMSDLIALRARLENLFENDR